MCHAPRLARVVERAEGEPHGVTRGGLQGAHHLRLVGRPRRPRGGIQLGGAARAWPAAEDLDTGGQQLLRPVLFEEAAPVFAGAYRLATTVEIGCLFGPVDGQVDLADLFERLGRVLQPRRDLATAHVGADDRLHVSVGDGQAARVPGQHRPAAAVSGGLLPCLGVVQAPLPERPLVLLAGFGAEALIDPVEFGPIQLEPSRAERRRVGDRVDLEEVLPPVELEVDHPPDQPRHVGLCRGRRPGMQGE